jgi:hypothetical protein
MAAFLAISLRLCGLKQRPWQVSLSALRAFRGPRQPGYFRGLGMTSANLARRSAELRSALASPNRDVTAITN